MEAWELIAKAGIVKPLSGGIWKATSQNSEVVAALSDGYFTNVKETAKRVGVIDATIRRAAARVLTGDAATTETGSGTGLLFTPRFRGWLYEIGEQGAFHGRGHRPMATLRSP